MHRVSKTVRLPTELWEALADEAETMDRSLNYVVTQALKAHVGKVVSQCNHSATTVVSPRCSPSLAPAPEHLQDRQTDSKKESLSKPDPVALVVEAVESAEWYGAKLPKAETTESYISKLMRSYPEMAPQHVYDASMWLLNNPSKRKKYLGGFLTHWMRKSREIASERPSKPVRRPEAQVDFLKGTADIDISHLDPNDPESANFDGIGTPKEPQR